MHEYFDHEEARRFFKLGAVAIGLLAVFLGVETLNAWKDLRTPGADPRTIVVTGYGEAFATPDIATFNYSVSADASSVEEAQAKVTESANAILSAMKNLGVEERDIRTTDYSVYPKYRYETAVCGPNYCPPSRQVPDGFTVSHTVEVKVRQTAEAGKALSAAGQNGATNISSLSFTLDKPEAVKNEARDEAVEEARTKAKELAKSLGVRLGKVVDFSESTYTPGPYFFKAEDARGGTNAVSAPTLPTGENKVTSNVTIVYEIR